MTSPRPTARATWGGAVLTVILLLLLLVGLAGFNYYRNIEVERAAQKSGARPFNAYSDADLAKLAAGYRLALEEAKQDERLGQRVKVKERHHFGDKIKEFERVQKVARRSRDAAIDVAELAGKVTDIEAEQRRRTTSPLVRHLGLAFRL